MLIFLFSFKTLEEYVLLHPFSRAVFCHLCCPLLCYGKGGQRDRNLGIRSIMDGGLLIREKEMEQEKEAGTGRGSETAVFKKIICLNTAGSQQQAWPDLAACFVRSVVMLLTRSVLTQTSPLSAT